MNQQVGSLIRNVSNLGDEVLNQVAEAPFQWWGATPEQARKTMVNKPKGLVDKRTTLKEAVQKYIKDASTSALAVSSTPARRWPLSTKSFARAPRT